MTPLKFSAEPFFPRTQYQSVCTANRALTVTYLIAQDHPKFDQIKTEAMKLNKLKLDWKKPANAQNLTPLHVAVWRQNASTIRFLLEQGCDPSAADAIGLLPVHYAEAIGNPEIIALIRSATKTAYVSYANLWNRLLEKPDVDSNFEFSYALEDGIVQRGDSEVFTKLTSGAIHTSSMFFKNRRALLNMLSKSLQNKVNDAIKPAYDPSWIETLEKESIPLQLTMQAKTGFGVTASRPLKPHQPIVIYSGEVVAPEDEEKGVAHNTYFMDPIEGHKHRNLAAMINEGFPNCHFDSIRHPSGIYYVIVVPLRPIQEGEELFVNYGGHDIKSMQRVELNLEEAKAYLKEKSFLERFDSELLPLLQKGQRGEALTPGEIREFYIVGTKHEYIMRTPSLMHTLIFEGSISIQDVRTMGTAKRCLPHFSNDPGKQKEFLSFAVYHEDLHRFSQGYGWDIQREVHAAFNELSKEYHAETVQMFLKYVHSYLVETQSRTKHMPREDFKEICLKVFLNGAKYYELTRRCMHESRDLTNEEIALLDRMRHEDFIFEFDFLQHYNQLPTSHMPQFNAWLNTRATQLNTSLFQFDTMMEKLSHLPQGSFSPQIIEKLYSLKGRPEKINAFLGV